MNPRLKTVIFSLIPVTALLLVLEIAGRWLYPFEPDRRALQNARHDPRVALSYFNSGAGAQAILWDVGRMERRYLPFLGFLGEPGTKLPTLSTNQLGFRDEPLSSRRPGEVRILVLGGSTAWGVGASSNDATVRGVMQRLLNDRGGATYRVMSGAFLGYTSRQEMTVLTALLEEFDPDVVVSLTGYNDVTTMIDDSGGVLQRPEAQMLAGAVTNHLRPMDTLTAIRKVVGSLGVWRLVVYFKERTGLSAPRPWDVSFDSGRSQRRAAQVADIHQINADYSRRHGKRYIIAMQPDLYSTKKVLTQEEVVTKERFTSVSRGIDRVYTQYRQDVASRLEALPNVTFIDLRALFDDLPEPVFIDSCHLVDRGYELIAEAIVEVID